MRLAIAVLTVALATCAVAATPALSQSFGEKTGINAAIGISPRTRDFVREATVGGMFEIQSSQLAEQKGDTVAKPFAEHMITDHTRINGELKALVDSGKVKGSVPTALDTSSQIMLDKLKSLNGADFEKQYADDQVSAHKDAVDLFQRYAKGGKNADLKAWAAKTLPTLQEHLKMALALAAAPQASNSK